MEEAQAAIRELAVRESVQQSGLDVAAQVIREDTNDQLDFQRHITRRLDG